MIIIGLTLPIAGGCRRSQRPSAGSSKQSITSPRANVQSSTLVGIERSSLEEDEPIPSPIKGQNDVEPRSDPKPNEHEEVAWRQQAESEKPVVENRFAASHGNRGKWEAQDAGYAATFADGVGNTVVGTFHNEVSWETGANGALTLITWDDGAKFVLQEAAETEGKSDFKIPNWVIKPRVRTLESSKTGTLQGNIKSVSLSGKIKYYGNDFTRLETAAGEYTIVWDDFGQRLSKELNGQSGDVDGLLTGEIAYDMTSSLSSPFSGAVSSVIEVPSLKVLSFRAREK
jgi:hypothetical protein